ncbi:hypothetical protein KAR91_38585 [Candidatus Pacearchaeota archaeon]|nr:hypothetical protein [Candidatus Pacearchaeota archaeon]
MGNKALGALISTAAVIIALGWGFCTETITSGTESPVKYFGNILDEPLTEGFHVVNPLKDYTNFSLRTTTFTEDNLNLPSGDKLVSKVDVTYTGEFIPGMTPSVFKNIGSAKTFYQKFVKRQIPAFIVKSSLMHAKESGDFYKKETFNRITASTLEMANKFYAPLGYRMTSVSFSDPELPGEIIASVKATIKRTQDVQKQAQSLEIKDLEAQESTMDAKAAAESAGFEATAIEALADADAYKVRTAADAEAYANSKRSDSVTDKLIDYMGAQAKMNWNGSKATTLTVFGDGALAPKPVTIIPAGN